MNGNLMVRNGKIDKYLFDGGYAQATASGTTDKFTFYYQNKDHLGTVRETVTSTGAMKQRVNYYPFGGQLVDTLKAMVLSPNSQQYKYNGKEFDGTFGLNTYDYGPASTTPSSQDGIVLTPSARSTTASVHMRIVRMILLTLLILMVEMA